MLELKHMNYYQEHNRYVKHIGNYTIEVFSAKEPGFFLRRILLQDKIVDIRKVNIHNIEKDTVFADVVKNRALATRLQPIEVQNLAVGQRFFDQDDEVRLDKFLKELSGVQNTEEQKPGFIETERLTTKGEINLKKRRGV